MIQDRREVPVKKKSSRGGAREGAGRKSLYGDALTDAFTARVDDEQGAAIGAWCAKKRIDPATLFREVALLRAGVGSLGLGVEAVRKTDRGVILEGARVFPVKFTERQARAVRVHCEKKRVLVSPWLREVVLEYIGRSDLGIRGEARTLEKALGAA